MYTNTSPPQREPCCELNKRFVALVWCSTHSGSWLGFIFFWMMYVIVGWILYWSRWSSDRQKIERQVIMVKSFRNKYAETITVWLFRYCLCKMLRGEKVSWLMVFPGRGNQSSHPNVFHVCSMGRIRDDSRVIPLMPAERLRAWNLWCGCFVLLYLFFYFNIFYVNAFMICIQ